MHLRFQIVAAFLQSAIRVNVMSAGQAVAAAPPREPRAAATDDAAATLDRALVVEIERGSADALERFYDLHGQMVFSLARRIVRQEDAEEVVQDVFSQVWREARRYQQTRASVVGWLVVITRTRAIDRLRVCQARPDWHPLARLDACPQQRDATRTPEQATIAADDATRVRNALCSLSAVQRTLLNLAYFEGLTHVEIATQTGTPLGTVKGRLRAAVWTLRSALSL